MNEKDYEYFHLWSSMDFFAERVYDSLKYIEKITGTPYVAVSGGKDSLVMLHLITRVNKEIKVFHWDYGNDLMPREIEKESLECIKQISQNIIYQKRRSTGRNDSGFGYRSFYAAIDRMIEEYNFTGAFIGLREEESCRRKSRIRYSKKRFPEYYPLATWKWQDVWAYIVKNNIKYPSVYDIYGGLKGYQNARLVTFFDQEFEFLGSPYIDNFLLPKFKW